MIETIGIFAGLFLTIAVYSYIFGDNFLYRLAIHILVGVSAGYAGVIVVQAVIGPAILSLSSNGDPVELVGGLVPIVLGLFLLLPRNRPALIKISNSGVAILIGIGAAVALVGAIAGTLLPQTTSAGAENPLVAILSGLFTICTLLYFRFVIRPLGEEHKPKPRWQAVLGDTIGRAVIMITFGALFATTLNTSLTLLTTQLNGIYQSVTAFVN